MALWSHAEPSGSKRRRDAQMASHTTGAGSVTVSAALGTSVSTATIPVGTGSTAYVPRFYPSTGSDPVWEGHLFRFDLYNEFVAGVDKNGDGKTDGVFLVDADGDIVTEDDKGNFHKMSCTAGTCVQAGQANPIWDAGGSNTVVDAISGLTKAPQLNVAGTNANRKIYTAYYDPTDSTAINGWVTTEFKAVDSSGNWTPQFARIRDALGLDASVPSTNTPRRPSRRCASTAVAPRPSCSPASTDWRCWAW